MSIKEYNPEGFALQIFKDRYAISPEESFQEACLRVASFIASSEDGKKIKHFEEKFFEILNNNRLVPGGRIFRGAGRPKPQMLNCFIMEFNSLDSREGWGEIIKDIIIVSGTGGGAGINFSKVRPRGAPIRGLGGESTGSVSLMEIIDSAAEQIRGGSSRRAALMFCLDWNHPDLLEFLEVKLDHKKLKNANISVCIDNEFLDLVEQDKEIIFKWGDKEYHRVKARIIWDKIIKNSLEVGDPGLLNRGFANEENNLYYLKEGELVSTNPCLPLRSIVLTKNGLRTLGKINIGEEIWSESGWTKVINIIPRGKKSIYKFETTRGYLESTIDHNIVSNGYKISVSEADNIDTIVRETKLDKLKLNIYDIMDGLVIGDGTRYNKHVGLCIGKKDQDYFKSEINELIDELRGSHEFVYKVKTSINVEEIPSMHLRKIPDRFYYGDNNKVVGFLRGLYSANGCFIEDRGRGKIGLKSTSKYLILQVQQMLSSLGIRSYYIEDKEYKRIFKEGQKEYECKKSYALFITWDRAIFASNIGFIQKYKQEKLNNFILHKNKNCCRPYEQSTKIQTATYVEDIDVFDITVNNSSHTFWCNGFNIANCGEIWGIENDCCDLSSINLYRHVVNGKIDWDLLDETTRLGVRFLDNVLTQNYFPLKKIEETCKKIRRIGLGVLGTHDMLLEMGIKYSSKEAIETLDKIMGFIKKKAYDESIILAAEKGQFELLDREKFIQSGFCKNSLSPAIRRKILQHGIRNCAILDIAPTGTTSILSGVSSGIEPMFSPVYRRRFNKYQNIQKNEREQSEEIVIHPLLVKFIREKRDFSHFEGSHEISVEQHIKIQRVCQNHIDNSLSKTCNLPKDFTSEDLSKLILDNIRFLKGITIYRDSSKENSPLSPIEIEKAKEYLEECKTEVTDNSCPSGKCEI